MVVNDGGAVSSLRGPGLAVNTEVNPRRSRQRTNVPGPVCVIELGVTVNIVAVGRAVEPENLVKHPVGPGEELVFLVKVYVVEDVPKYGARNGLYLASVHKEVFRVHPVDAVSDSDHGVGSYD